LLSIAVALVVLGSATWCEAQTKTATPSATTTTSMPIVVLDRGNGAPEGSIRPSTAMKKPDCVTVDDAESWRNLWQALKEEKSSPPDVDFAKDEVIVVAVSEPTAGYKLEVAKLERDGPDALIVTVRERPPKPDAVVAQVL